MIKKIPHIDKLGISPWPWLILLEIGSIWDANGCHITRLDCSNDKDAVLMRSAPKLYAALWSAYQYADKLPQNWQLPDYIKKKMHDALEEAIVK